MNIRFFADSWFWTWYGKHTFKSKDIKAWAESEGFELHDALPTMDGILNRLGHNSISFVEPGINFYGIVDTVCDQTSHENIKYNVVFFTNLFRYRDQIGSFDVENYDRFMEKWNVDVVVLLERLQDWAEKNDQQVILLGGQSTLSKEIFDCVKKKTNIHLLSECITHQILHEYFNHKDACSFLNGRKFGIFKLPEFLSWITDNWDKRFLEKVYQDSMLWNETIVKHNIYSPDTRHPTVTGQLFFLDLLLHKIDVLEGETI